MKFEQVEIEQNLPGHLVMYGMESLETECGIRTDSYCDVMDSLMTFLYFLGGMMEF